MLFDKMLNCLICIKLLPLNVQNPGLRVHEFNNSHCSKRVNLMAEIIVYMHFGNTSWDLVMGSQHCSKNGITIGSIWLKWFGYNFSFWKCTDNCQIFMEWIIQTHWWETNIMINIRLLCAWYCIYVCQWPGSSLVQVMVLFGTMPLPVLMQINASWTIRQQFSNILVKLQKLF